MKQITHIIRRSILALALVLGFVVSAQAADLDFDLVNDTGYSIKAVYVSPTSLEEWGDNILEGKLKDGESLPITFHPKTTATQWDLRVSWADGSGDVFWRKLKLEEISALTLQYDEKTQETSAKAE